MGLNEHDSIAEAASNIVSDFLRQAIEEIEHSFGEGFAKKNATLVASYMQAAAIKNHGDAVADSIDNIAYAIGDLDSSVGYVGEQLAHLRNISEHFANLVDVVDNKKSPDFWMVSDIAAIDKASELGIEVSSDESFADLRYRIHQKLAGR